ncbi:MAG: hypothetical protein QOJ57_1592 [Thermoleophilaceae bacterium]|nr:hypothetical protein [Thermoleophilaceae bacterium]
MNMLCTCDPRGSRAALMLVIDASAVFDVLLAA